MGNRWIVVLIATLLACGGDDDEPRCASPADCEDGEVCINGACMPGSTDAGEDAEEEDAGDPDSGEDAGEEDASVDVVPDTFDAGPLTCPGPGGDRNDPIVLYTFQAPDAIGTITDRAPALPDVPLVDNVGGLTVDNSTGSIILRGGQAAADLESSDALTTALTAAGSFAIEVWFTEDDVVLEETSGPERIATLSLDSSERAFTVGQIETSLSARFRTSTTWPNGIYCDELVVGDANPPMATLVAADAMDGSTTKHVVLSFDAGDGHPRLYLDGEEVGDPSNCRPGVLDWPTGYRFALGDEFDATRTWEGVIHRVAIYARSMTEAEAACWYGAGVDADVFR